jgi:hypothetical protein
MGLLRARAYLDLLLGQDSRPRRGDAGQGSAGPASAADASAGTPGGRPEPGSGRPGMSARPEPGAVPAGFAGRVTLTVPLATLLDLADRPGEIPGIGPVDPWLARDLATAAAAHPKTTWCVTVTDEQGHAVGHGCARPEPKGHRKRAGPGPPLGGTGFAFTPADRDGPPGGYGTWRLRIPGDRPHFIHALDPIATGNCDHRYQAEGHDPGGKAAAPRAGPACQLYRARVPETSRQLRLRAQHALRGGRPHVLV